MKKLAYLLLVMITFTSCQAQQEKKIELVAPATFEKEIASKKGHIIDVRTPKEYSAGHIAGAVNLHVYDKDFLSRVDELDKYQPVYVYCKAGSRSAEAVEAMKTRGFIHIIELDGGIDAWTEAGKPVKK